MQETVDDIPTNAGEGSLGCQRARFTAEEDEKLLRLQKQQYDWNEISRQLGNRSARQCRERFQNYLDPELNTSNWTPDEDELLLQKESEMGKKWKKMMPYFQNRSNVNIKNRFATLQNRKKANERLNSYSNSHLSNSPNSPNNFKETISNPMNNMNLLGSSLSQLNPMNIMQMNNANFNNMNTMNQMNNMNSINNMCNAGINNQESSIMHQMQMQFQQQFRQMQPGYNSFQQQMSNPNQQMNNPQMNNQQMNNPQMNNPQMNNPQMNNPQMNNPQMNNPQINFQMNAPMNNSGNYQMMNMSNRNPHFIPRSQPSPNQFQFKPQYQEQPKQSIFQQQPLQQPSMQCFNKENSMLPISGRPMDAYALKESERIVQNQDVNSEPEATPPQELNFAHADQIIEDIFGDEQEIQMRWNFLDNEVSQTNQINNFNSFFNGTTLF
ncbi:hypothetical protein TRFO_26617 [Tritrichomonas foetus]|uniref:Myb-like DNA-binding domain containing protein n=1 Tax=Tritrichomonas foetus TaxID=1144522 RepID=A0A1J4K283_9EUKA|nr:hypothetical protein TRFO_26617 [Tritrichomonas foetus]|eukprot:OHT05553.1 hypothetical protein TRFO_26617 [Tritrichomonas foetus]